MEEPYPNIGSFGCLRSIAVVQLLASQRCLTWQSPLYNPPDTTATACVFAVSQTIARSTSYGSECTVGQADGLMHRIVGQQEMHTVACNELLAWWTSSCLNLDIQSLPLYLRVLLRPAST